MSAIRPRSAALLALPLLLMSNVTTSPVLAADSPVAAGEALLAKIAAGDFETLDEVVCAEFLDDIRAQFDPASRIGVLPEGMDLEAFLSNLSVRIEDGAVELLSEEAETATVRLTGTMSLSFFGIAESEPIDEELTVTAEDGEWLVCEDLGFGGSGMGDESLVSTEGLCAALTIEELDALGPLQYDSSFSGPDSCTYQSSSLETGFYNVNLYIEPGTLDTFRQWFPGGVDSTVAGAPAYGSDAQLWVELPDQELLAVAAYVDEGSQPEGFDALAYATAIAEIALPRMPGVERFDYGAFEPDLVGDSDPLQGIDLCAALSLDQLNAMSPLSYDATEGGPGSCSYTNSDFTRGLHFVSTNYSSGSLEDLKPIFTDGQDLTVAGLPAYYAVEQLWVDVDGGLLSVAAFIGGSPGSEDMDGLEYASGIATAVIAALPDLAAESGAEPGEATLGGHLCDLVSVDEMAALGLPLDSLTAVSDTACTYDTDAGTHALSISLEDADLDLVRQLYPDGQELTVAEHAAYTDGRSLWVALEPGVLAIEPDLGLSAVAASLDRVSYATSVAELLLSRLPPSGA